MKYTLTQENWSKVLKGFLIACTGGAALAGLDFLGTIEVGNELAAVLISTLVPTFTNMVREWLKE